MSLQTDGVWKGGAWAATVWATGVWYEQAAPTVPVPAGGTLFVPDVVVIAKQRRKPADNRLILLGW